MKITNDIYQVGGEKYTSSEDAAVYLIKADESAAVIDAGCGPSAEQIVQNIRECGVDPEQVKYLLLTHCHFDHTGGASALKELLQCQIVAHELDAGFLETGDNTVTAAKWYSAAIQPFSADRKLTQSSEDIQIDGMTIKALHTPGHSPGSVVYLAESEGLKVLFGQDVHGPIINAILSDKDDYLKSLNLLLSLEADILCEGHYGVFRGKKNVADFISSFI